MLYRLCDNDSALGTDSELSLHITSYFHGASVQLCVPWANECIHKAQRELRSPTAATRQHEPQPRGQRLPVAVERLDEHSSTPTRPQQSRPKQVAGSYYLPVYAPRVVTAAGGIDALDGFAIVEDPDFQFYMGVYRRQSGATDVVNLFNHKVEFEMQKQLEKVKN